MIKDEYKEKIDKTINELVYEKTALQKIYNYYNGKRDIAQYQHLEDNYGIGNPTSISFTPLIKKHIDVLVGEYIGLNPELKISCRDDKTISNIMREKQLKINLEVHNYLKQYLSNNIISILLDNKEITTDPLIAKQLQEVAESANNSFVSEYEIAAQYVLTYIRQNRKIDLERKLNEIFRNLLISGMCYWRVKPTASEDNVSIEVLNTINTFVERNFTSPYLADSKRSVIRRWLSKEDIVNNFYDKMSDDDLDKLESMSDEEDQSSTAYFIRYTGSLNSNDGVVRPGPGSGILGGLEAHPRWPGESALDNRTINYNSIPVYEVEWLEIDYETGIMTRHEAVKIGSEIYLHNNDSEFVSRSIDNPKSCRLSVNGLFFLDEYGDPYSIIGKTMDLQDKYDLLLFQRDNLIANSGTVGDFVDVTSLPDFLGDTMPERLAKYKAYKKQGTALIAPPANGDVSPMLNTIFNGYDDTVKLNSIQAIQLAIQSIEANASSITGVLPEMLAQYEQKDAVSNVKLGVRMSGLLTKQYFKTMDIVFKEINYDALDLSKIVYKKGLSGTIILGDNYSKIFTAIPKYFTMSDYNINIVDSTETFKDQETIKSISTELIKAGYADPEMVVQIISTKSLTSLKEYVSKSMEKKKQESGEISQLKEQIGQYEGEMKNLKASNDEIQKQNNKLNEEISKKGKFDIELEKERLRMDQEKIDNQKDLGNKEIEIKKEKLQAEVAQMYDENPHNNKINTR